MTPVPSVCFTVSLRTRSLLELKQECSLRYYESSKHTYSDCATVECVCTHTPQDCQETWNWWGQTAISCALQTSLGGETLSTVGSGAEQGSPSNKDTQTQQPDPPYRNGDSTCRQRHVDRRRRHLGHFLLASISGKVQISH